MGIICQPAEPTSNISAAIEQIPYPKGGWDRTYRTDMLLHAWHMPKMCHAAERTQNILAMMELIPHLEGG
jgi:hypothetical protein